MVKRWDTWGGVLLVSDKTLARIVSANHTTPTLLEQFQPHVLVLDEAHTMVRNSATKIFKALTSITTPRKIGKNYEIDSVVLSTTHLNHFCLRLALSGSPFQNNVSYSCFSMLVS
jgi:SNF2 family DNA or RNA helicase